MLNFAEVVGLVTTEPLPGPVMVTVLFASRVTVLVPPEVGRTTVPKFMSWVLVMVVGEITVAVALAVADTVPEARAPVASPENARAAPAASRALRIFMNLPQERQSGACL